MTLLQHFIHSYKRTKTTNMNKELDNFIALGEIARDLPDCDRQALEETLLELLKLNCEFQDKVTLLLKQKLNIKF